MNQKELESRPYYLSMRNNKVSFQVKDFEECRHCQKKIINPDLRENFCSEECRQKNTSLIKNKKKQPKLYLVK